MDWCKLLKKNKNKIKKKLDNFQTYLLSCLIFLIPSNLFYKILESQAYVNGLKIDYLIMKLYASDIFIILLMFTWLIELFIKKQKIKIKNPYILLTLFSLLFFRQIFTHKPIAAIYFFLRLIFISLLFLFLQKHKRLLKKKIIRSIIFFTLIFQSSVAILQFVLQKSLYGYYFLGEVNLKNFYGITKASFQNIEKILPYGTTAHPNILAGFLSVFSLIYLQKKNSYKWKKTIVILITLIIIYLSQSWSAALSFIIGRIYLSIQKKSKWKNKQKNQLFVPAMITASLIFSIFLSRINFDSNNNSLTRRIALNQAAWKMIYYHPFIGIGLNNFTNDLQYYTQNHLLDNFIQPVHHTFLLILSENGFLCTAIIIILLQSIKLKLNKEKIITALVILLPIISLDHYLLSQQTGLLLTVFSLSLI